MRFRRVHPLWRGHANFQWPLARRPAPHKNLRLGTLAGPILVGSTISQPISAANISATTISSIAPNLRARARDLADAGPTVLGRPSTGSEWSGWPRRRVDPRSPFYPDRPETFRPGGLATWIRRIVNAALICWQFLLALHARHARRNNGFRSSSALRSRAFHRPLGRAADPIRLVRLPSRRAHQLIKGMPGERPPASPPNSVAGRLTAHVGGDPVHQDRHGPQVRLGRISSRRRSCSRWNR